jgi:hypothetical protein
MDAPAPNSEAQFNCADAASRWLNYELLPPFGHILRSSWITCAKCAQPCSPVKKARRSEQSLKFDEPTLIGVGRPKLMTAWFARTATLLLFAFPIFLSSLLLPLITILLVGATLLLLSAFQFFLFLSVHSNPPRTLLLKNKRILGL